MSNFEPMFSWQIDERTSWPPYLRPKSPFGPTAVEVIRSCPLRACFSVSPGYERRRDFAARCGTAFHKVLESLYAAPPPLTDENLAAEEARQRYDKAISSQEAEASKRPREQGLPRDAVRIELGREAIVAEALRLVRLGIPTLPQKRRPSIHRSQPLVQPSYSPIPTEGIEVEIDVMSADGVFEGRIDRAEYTPDGTRLLDYKSALRPELAERYARQLQMYGQLWHDTRGEWPREAFVIYPLSGSTYRVPMSREICERVTYEAREVIERLDRGHSIEKLATPGDVCKACEFRPWCRPFWGWQHLEESHSIALDRASLGFEGEVISQSSVRGHIKLSIAWRSAQVSIIAPLERFSHARNINVGQRVRCLDMRLKGLRQQPQADINGYSELYVINN